MTTMHVRCMCDASLSHTDHSNKIVGHGHVAAIPEGNGMPGWIQEKFHESWGETAYFSRLCGKYMTDEHICSESHKRRESWWEVERENWLQRGGDHAPQKKKRGESKKNKPSLEPLKSESEYEE